MYRYESYQTDSAHYGSSFRRNPKTLEMYHLLTITHEGETRFIWSQFKEPDMSLTLPWTHWFDISLSNTRDDQLTYALFEEGKQLLGRMYFKEEEKPSLHAFISREKAQHPDWRFEVDVDENPFRPRDKHYCVAVTRPGCLADYLKLEDFLSFFEETSFPPEFDLPELDASELKAVWEMPFYDAFHEAEKLHYRAAYFLLDNVFLGRPWHYIFNGFSCEISLDSAYAKQWENAEEI